MGIRFWALDLEQERTVDHILANEGHLEDCEREQWLRLAAILKVEAGKIKDDVLRERLLVATDEDSNEQNAIVNSTPDGDLSDGQMDRLAYLDVEFKKWQRRLETAENNAYLSRSRGRQTEPDGSVSNAAQPHGSAARVTTSKQD